MKKHILTFLPVLLAALLHTYIYYNNINSYMNTDPVIQVGQARTLLEHGTTGQLFADPEDLSQTVIPPHSAMWPPLYLFLLAGGMYFNENPIVVLVALQFLICFAFFFFYGRIITLLRASLGRFFTLLIYASWFALPCIFMPGSGQVDFLPAVLLLISTYAWMRQAEEPAGAMQFSIIAALCLGLSFWTRYSYWVYLCIPVVLLALNFISAKDSAKRKISKGLFACIIISLIFLIGIMVYQKTLSGYYSQLDEGTHNPNTGFFPVNLLKIYLFPLLIYGGDIGVKALTEVHPLLLAEFFALFACFLVFTFYGFKKLKNNGLNPESIFAIAGILVLCSTVFVLAVLSLRYKEEAGDFTYVSLVRYYYPVYVFLVVGILAGIKWIFESKSTLLKTIAGVIALVVLTRGIQHALSDTRKFLQSEEVFMLSDKNPELAALEKELSDWKGGVVLLRIDQDAWDEKFYALVYPFVDLVSIARHSNQSLEEQRLRTSKPVKIIFLAGDEMIGSESFRKWVQDMPDFAPTIFYRNAASKMGYYSFVLQPA